MTFIYNRQFEIKFEGVYDVVEAYGAETVKMAFKNMKAEKRKMKKSGYKNPKCVMVMTEDEILITNNRNNICIFKCQIASISYVMSSLFDNLYIAIIITQKSEQICSSKCLIVKAKYGKTKYIISHIRDCLLKRHSGLLNTAQTNLPCKNCSKIFDENNLLKGRIKELGKLIEFNKLEEFMKNNRIFDLTSFVNDENIETRTKRAATFVSNELENEIKHPRKISCPITDLTKYESESNLITLDEFINWDDRNPWKETF